MRALGSGELLDSVQHHGDIMDRIGRRGVICRHLSIS